VRRAIPVVPAGASVSFYGWPMLVPLALAAIGFVSATWLLVGVWSANVRSGGVANACRRCAVTAAVIVAACLSAVSAHAQPAAPPLQQALAVTPAGVVWASADGIVLEVAGRTSRRLAVLGNPAGPYVLESSGDTFALLTGSGLWSGMTSSGAAPLAPAVVDGCWQPQSDGLSTFFDVADGEVVLDAKSICAPGTTGQTSQPVFVHPARGGSWRVLTRVAGSAPPVLASDGALLAIGTQQSSAQMSVRVLNMRSGRTVDHFSVADGYLEFASPTRLVLTIPPVDAGFPLGQVVVNPAVGALIDGGVSLLYRPALYSTAGRLLARLGLSSFPPLVSDGHMVTVDNASDGPTTISVRPLPSGPTTNLISFANPARTLLTEALGWPTLAIDSTTSPRLPPGEYDCGNAGYFGAPSPPTLSALDLARAVAYVPAPAIPPWPAAECGMPPV